MGGGRPASEGDCAAAEDVAEDGEGHTPQSVARVLVLSPYTVQTRIKHIYAKIGIHHRAEPMDYVNLKRTSFDEA